MEIPRRPLGTSGVLVSALGLGGYHLVLAKSEREGIRIVHAAIDAGVTFMDNAWEYHDGRSEQIMGKALVDRRKQVFLMTKLCTHGRDKREAMRQLEQSLRRCVVMGDLCCTKKARHEPRQRAFLREQNPNALTIIFAEEFRRERDNGARLLGRVGSDEKMHFVH